MSSTLSASTQGSLLVLDNHDSFTYNLVDELSQLGFTVEVYRNSVDVKVITQRLAELKRQGPVAVVLSPGPGYPRHAGNLMALIKHCVGRYPLLGICLGFQAIAEHFGGHTLPCNEAAHGKSAVITTTDHPLFSRILDYSSGQLTVARYHSLQVSNMPSELEIIAHYHNIPMALCHKTLPIAGLQFHPESIMTIRGTEILHSCISFLTLQGHHNA